MSDCIGPINIIPDNNQVVLQDVNKTITVIDNNCCTTIDVTQPVTSVVQVLTGPLGLTGDIGPQGPSGSQGPVGPAGPTGSSQPFSYVSGNIWATTSSIEISGSLTVSGSSTFTNIGLALFSGSTNLSGSGTLNGYSLLTSNNTGSLLLSSSFNNFTSSYYTDSASFNTSILNNSSSIALLSSSFLNTSSSLSTRVTALENFSSSLDNTFATDAQLNAATASLSSSIAILSSSYIASSASFSASIASLTNTTSSYVLNSQTSSMTVLSASFASTASLAPNYLPLTGGTINGNVTVNGTASIAFLNVTYESASVIYSSGSNQFGDASNDVQTLYGTVDVKTGPVLVTGSVIATSGFTGSLLGTSSYASQALSSSHAVSSSYAVLADTASGILGGSINHVPYFKTNTTLATSSIYQSGSTTVVINQDNATTANPEALYVWQPSTSSFNVISGKGNLNNYLQLNIQNTNQGVDASSDVVATANNGSEVDNYIDMGINSENFAGFLGGPNDSYVYTHGHNFWIGNINDGYKTYFFNSSSLLPIITLNADNAEVTGSLYGTASWANNAISSSHSSTASYALTATSSSYALSASYAPDTTFPYTGSAIISGSLIITGSERIEGAIRYGLTNDPNPTGTDTTGTWLFTSASNTTLGNDLYFRQNGNLSKWKWIEGSSLNTGILYGGVVTFSGSYVYVSSGSGIIVDYNATSGSEISPISTYVNWGPLTSSITNIASTQVTYIYINSNGNLIQQNTPFTPQQYSTTLPLGAVGHFNNQYITAFGAHRTTAYALSEQSNQFIDAFGPLKYNGYSLAGQANSLSLSVGSGTAFVHGGFYDYNPEFPSLFDSNAAITASIVRCYISSSQTVFDTNNNSYYTTINPGFYNDITTGVTSSLSNNNWSIQRVFSYPPTNTLYIYYGQNSYTTLVSALDGLASDTFTEGATKDYTILIGYLIVKSNTIDITDIENKILGAGLFRTSGVGAGGGAVAIAALDDLSDVTITTPSNGQALIYNSGIWINGNPTSASYASTASLSVSSSYALTASFALNGGGGGQTFPYTGSAVITGSLIVTGSTTSTQGFTGSLFGTASYANQALSSSYAVTASHALVADTLLGSVTSASYAATASMGVNFVVQNTLTLNGTLTDHATVASSIVGSNNLYTQATGSYTSAFGKYTLHNGVNARAGEFITVWNGTTTVYTDTSTTDIGDTSDITFTSAIVTGNIQINAVAGSSGWTIKMLTTFI